MRRNSFVQMAALTGKSFGLIATNSPMVWVSNPDQPNGRVLLSGDNLDRKLFRLQAGGDFAINSFNPVGGAPSINFSLSDDNSSEIARLATLDLTVMKPQDGIGQDDHRVVGWFATMEFYIGGANKTDTQTEYTQGPSWGVGLGHITLGNQTFAFSPRFASWPVTGVGSYTALNFKIDPGSSALDIETAVVGVEDMN